MEKVPLIMPKGSLKKGKIDLIVINVGAFAARLA
jgi:hypothetical protein